MTQKKLFKSVFHHLGYSQGHNSLHPENSLIENLSDDVTLTMIKVPGGTFMMGSSKTDSEAYDNEKPQHRVKISSFWVSQSPITQAQWKAVAHLSAIQFPLEPNPSNFKGANRPVEGISWYEAVEFCQRLSQHTGHCYRLPSEAEWEYACRAGTTTPFHFGEVLMPELANFNSSKNSSESQKQLERGTTPVGSFQATNNFGLFDVHGNVYEWCIDHWHDNYQGAPTNGSAWLCDDEDSLRVIRGGFWLNYASHCRSAYRNFSSPEAKSSAVGFRVVCAID